MFGRKKDWRGYHVRDINSKMTGIALSKSTYLSGTVQYAVQPPCPVDEKTKLQNGALPEAYMIDEQQLEKIDKGTSDKRTEIAAHKIKLGETYFDEVTGFKGVATALTEHFNGCVTVIVEPKRVEDKKLSEAQGFDWKRLTFVDPGVSKTITKPATTTRPPGGPSIRAPMMRAPSMRAR
jgi:hypothetical protein